MNASNLKTFVTYATLGAGLASGLLLWNARQKMNLLSIPETTATPPISLAAPARLRSSTTETESALARTVQGQLDAFRADDYAKAFQFAAKGIQAGFTVNDFEQMVRRSFPMIADWKSARFGLSLDNGSEAVLQVYFQGEGKGETEFQYNMEKEEGTWRVGGVKGPVPNPATPGNKH
ncbi:MAG: DUF4864 domain-containing protein [Opitutaceae bacterium]|nr:DUF4864 domain-containing protein [Verrucomicrobiales bacterium]